MTDTERDIELFKALPAKSKKAWVENDIVMDWKQSSSGVWSGSWANPYYLNRSRLWWKWYNFCDLLPPILIGLFLLVVAGVIAAPFFAWIAELIWLK